MTLNLVNEQNPDYHSTAKEKAQPEVIVLEDNEEPTDLHVQHTQVITDNDKLSVFLNHKLIEDGSNKSLLADARRTEGDSLLKTKQRVEMETNKPRTLV